MDLGLEGKIEEWKEYIEALVNEFVKLRDYLDTLVWREIHHGVSTH
jgi:hypothetical protein